MAGGRRRENLGLRPGVVDGGERNKAKFAAWLRGAAARGAARAVGRLKVGRNSAPSSFYGVTWDKYNGASWAL